MNPYLYEKMLEEKRNQMLCEAAQMRLVRQSQKKHPTLRATFMLWMARKLISTGEKVRARYSAYLQVEQQTSKQLCSEKR